MPKTIVFVDDSKTVLATARMTFEELEEEGKINIITHNNPVVFLQELEEGKIDFDLLVSDVNMPEMNGMEMVRKVKQMDRFKTRPVVMLTTEDSAEMKAEGKSIGVSGWMVKPMNTVRLQQMVKMVLGVG